MPTALYLNIVQLWNTDDNDECLAKELDVSMRTDKYMPEAAALRLFENSRRSSEVMQC
jgi:hypothetical protein